MGKKLVNTLEEVSLENYVSRTHVAKDIDGKYTSDVLPFEYSTYGAADMRMPSAEFTFADGSRISKLTYKSYKIENGKPKLEGLPATYAEDGDKVMTLKIRLTDELQNVDAILSYSVFEDLDAIARNVLIVNNGDKLLLDSVMSATVDFYGMYDSEILHLDGAWARERHITRQPIVQGIQGINSRYGCSSAFHNPFMAICEKDASEKHADVREKLLRFGRAAVAAATMRGKSYLQIGSITMGIGGSIIDPHFLRITSVCALSQWTRWKLSAE